MYNTTSLHVLYMYMYINYMLKNFKPQKFLTLLNCDVKNYFNKKSFHKVIQYSTLSYTCTCTHTV